MWNRDSHFSVVSLHWWPRHDWSLWPQLRRASYRTITRSSCQQCDNPSWSHTALLSRFHTRCRSSFRLHNRHSRLLGEPCGEPEISLHSHTVSLVQWVTRLLPVMRDQGSIPRETGILLLALSRYKFPVPQHYSKTCLLLLFATSPGNVMNAHGRNPFISCCG